MPPSGAPQEFAAAALTAAPGREKVVNSVNKNLVREREEYIKFRLDVILMSCFSNSGGVGEHEKNLDVRCFNRMYISSDAGKRLRHRLHLLT